MTDKPDEGITQEELNLAAAAENQEMGLNPEVIAAQNKHLSNRVVILRAEVARLTKLVEELQAKLPKAPQDHQAPRKPRTRAKKKP